MRRSLLLAGSAAALLTLGTAGAAGADDTAVTLTVTGGALTIDAPATASGTGAIGAVTSVVIPVNDTVIRDDRGTLLGWTSTATATNLVDGTKSIPNTSMTWTTTVIDPLEGQQSVALPAAGPLNPGATVAVGLALVSGGGYSIDGTITVPVTALTQVGTYTSTLTTTVT